LKIEKAKISDAEQIHELVNKYAERGEMLPRALSEIYQNLRDYHVVREDDQVLACAALHISWDDMAEIRSLAVSEDKQYQGLGGKVVEACIAEAKEIDIPVLFCLTYKPAFFEKLGFRLVDKAELPRKVWNECFHCPKFPDCDENAMIYRLRPDESATTDSQKVISRHYIFEGRAVRLRVDTVLTPSGRQTTREIVEHSDAIVAVPIDADNNVIMVKQYREAVGKKLLELPAGGIDSGEEPVQSVRRELQEEIGFLPQKVEKIGGFYIAPGYSTEYLHLFFATQLKPKRLKAEDTDEIEVVKIPVSQIRSLLDSGEICDSKTIAGLTIALDLNLKGS